MSEVLIVRGLEELKTTYKQLPDKLKRGVIRRGVYAASRVVANAVKRVAPAHSGPYKSQPGRDSGRLRRGVVVKRARELTTVTQTGFLVTILRGKKYQRVGKRGINKDAYYWPWVDQGHRIVPRKGKGSSMGISARRRVARTAGGKVAGKGFMQKGLETSASAAINAMAAKMRADLAKTKVPE